MLYTVSTKYAMMALTALATQKARQPMKADMICGVTGIPEPFLASLSGSLMQAGILDFDKGQTGGLRLARSPSEISLADVVRAIEGEHYFRDCIFAIDPCDGTAKCPWHEVWGPTRDRIVEFLEQTTIQDLADVGKQPLTVSRAAKSRPRRVR